MRLKYNWVKAALAVEKYYGDITHEQEKNDLNWKVTLSDLRDKVNENGFCLLEERRRLCPWRIRGPGHGEAAVCKGLER